jgi:hypothetical protein
MRKERKDLRGRLYWGYFYGKESQCYKNAKIRMLEVRIIKMVLNLLRCHICRVENYPAKVLKPLKQ